VTEIKYFLTKFHFDGKIHILTVLYCPILFSGWHYIHAEGLKKLYTDNAIDTVLWRTRSSAIAEGPCSPSCQLKSCQLPRSSAETTCVTTPEQIEVMKLGGYSGAMCNKHEHSRMT